MSNNYVIEVLIKAFVPITAKSVQDAEMIALRKAFNASYNVKEGFDIVLEIDRITLASSTLF